MPSIAVVVQRVLTAGVPVLFLDTCIFLDIIRATKRRSPNCVRRGHELMELATTQPPGCLVVASSIVLIEWNNRTQEVLDEIRGHLEEIEDQAAHFYDACQVLGIVLPSGWAAYSTVALGDHLHALSKRLLDCSIPLDDDAECASRAIGRVVTNTPPSKKGGEAKDCVIIEQYLEVCRQLKTAGFQRKCVFSTSNTKDYCTASNLHPILAADFATVNLVFTSNLPWAVHEVTH